MNWIYQLRYLITCLLDRLRNYWSGKQQQKCTHCEETQASKTVNGFILFEGRVIGKAVNLRYSGIWQSAINHILLADAVVFDDNDLDRLYLNGVVVDVGQKYGFAVK